jgi:phosphopantetheinyl transferase
MDQVGEDGATATLAVKPARGLLRSQPSPAFLTDPVLLDQPGQVVGLWTAERLESGYVIFPFALEALHLYNYPRAEASATCRAHIALIGEQRVRSDLDIVGPDGRLWARFIGWEDRRFDLAPDFHRLLLAPAEVTLSRPWPAPAAQLPGALVHRLGLADFPKDFFTAHGGLWTRVLAHLVLGRRERALWQALRLPERRRLEWLLGRLAAKDAVRAHVRERLGLALSPAEVEVLPDEHGRPNVHGDWAAQLPRPPRLSISHSAGLALAVVAAGAEAGLGVDVERLGHLTEAAEAMAFSAEERELLAGLREDPAAEWPLRLWCAKEAAAKALGRGLAAGPRALVVTQVAAASGLVQVSAGAAEYTVFTWREDELIAAVTLNAVERENDRA